MIENLLECIEKAAAKIEIYTSPLAMLAGIARDALNI
jgi:hypothetical protein